MPWNRAEFAVLQVVMDGRFLFLALLLLGAVSCGKDEGFSSGRSVGPGTESVTAPSPTPAAREPGELDARKLPDLQDSERVSFMIRDMLLFQQLFDPTRRAQDGRILQESRIRRDVLHCHLNSNLGPGRGDVQTGRLERLRVAAVGYRPGLRLYVVSLLEEREHFSIGCLRTTTAPVTLGELRRAFGSAVEFGILDSSGNPVSEPTPFPPSVTATPVPASGPGDEEAVRGLEARGLSLRVTDRSRFNDLVGDSESLRIQDGEIRESGQIERSKPYCYAESHRGSFAQGEPIAIAKISEKSLGVTRELRLSGASRRLTLACYKRGGSIVVRELRTIFRGIADLDWER